MPELTPQQKALEQIYRGKSTPRPPNVVQQSLNNVYQKPAVNSFQKTQGRVAASDSVYRQSANRANRAKTQAKAAKFGKEASSAASKFKASSAQNISKFGGGLKGRFSPAIQAAKKVATQQGIKTASLGRLLANSRFLAGANSVPALALIVGNYYIWKKNIKDLRSLYRLTREQPDLDNPIGSTKIEEGQPPPFRGGQMPGVVYNIGGVAAKNGINYCETPILNNNWGYSVRGPIHGLAAKYIRTDDRYSCPNYASIVGKADVYLAYISFGDDPLDDRYSIIYFTDPHEVDSVVTISGVTRADGQPDTGGDPSGETSPVYSQGGVINNNVTNITNVTNVTKYVRDSTVANNLPPAAVVVNYYATTPTSEPKVELIPAAVPEVIPLPGDNVDKEPQAPTDSPVVKTVDTTTPTEVKKPEPHFSKVQRYPKSDAELNEVYKVIEEDRKKKAIHIDPFEPITGEPEDRGWYKTSKNLVLEKAAKEAGLDVKEKSSTKVSASPNTNRVTTTPTVKTDGKTETNPLFPVLIPGLYKTPTITTKVNETPTPKPTPVPVDPCKKGCGGASPGTGVGGGGSGLNTGLSAAELALLTRIDRTTTSTLSNVAHADYGLARIQGFADIAWKATHADKILNAVTTAMVIHNGAMLSKGLAYTVGEAATTTLQAMNIQDSEGNPFNVNAVVGGKLRQLVERVVGAENYEAFTKKIASYSRTYQAAANLADITFSLFDSAREIAETTAENTGKIGNALRESGAVYEDAYSEMLEKVNPQNVAMRKLEGLSTGISNISDAVDSIESVSSNVIEIQETYSELQAQKQLVRDEAAEAIRLTKIDKDKAKEDVQAKTDLEDLDFEAAPPEDTGTE